MTKLSELISKPVISLYNCECVGFVYNVLFDKQTKSIKYLTILDEENEIEYVISTKQIVNISNDAVVIRNSEELLLKQSTDLSLSNLENLIMKKIYNIDGQAYGLVKDFAFDERYKVVNILTDTNQEIETIKVIKIESIILCSDTKINLSRFKKKVKFERSNNFKVEIQQNTPKLPIKAIINEDLLLNRVVYNNIYDENNKLLIKSNTMISPATISLAKKHGRLKELTRYSF